MPTEPITVKLRPEPWVVPYVTLCIYFMKRNDWLPDFESVKNKVFTGIKVLG